MTKKVFTQRLTTELVDWIDNFARRLELQRPGLQMTRSDAVRILLVQSLETEWRQIMTELLQAAKSPLPVHVSFRDGSNRSGKVVANEDGTFQLALVPPGPIIDKRIPLIPREICHINFA